MAQTSNRLLDELARLATDAVGAAQGVRREVETVARSQIERILRDMDVATREEVDVLRDLVVAAREENEALSARIKALEDRLGAAPGTKPAEPANPATPA
jgi:BMFP domain-containing protein YqiC